MSDLLMKTRQRIAVCAHVLFQHSRCLRASAAWCKAVHARFSRGRKLLPTIGELTLRI